jgi:hypothetical protein
VLSICAVALDRLVNRIEQLLVAKGFGQKLNPFAKLTAMVPRSAIRVETRFSRCSKAPKPTSTEMLCFANRNQTIKQIQIYNYEKDRLIVVCCKRDRLRLSSIYAESKSPSSRCDGRIHGWSYRRACPPKNRLRRLPRQGTFSVFLWCIKSWMCHVDVSRSNT